MQAWGLIVLLISKAAGHLSVDVMEEDKAAGVLHRSVFINHYLLHMLISLYKIVLIWYNIKKFQSKGISRSY
jgi:hypothetical protein